MNVQCVFIWIETSLWRIRNNVCTVTGIAAWLLLLYSYTTQWLEPHVEPLVFSAFPHEFNQYLLKVSVTRRVTQQVQAVTAAFDKCENVSGWLQTRSFILIKQAGGWLANWLAVDIQGLSGAVKRTYCCIPAPTAALSLGFTSNNNSQLIPLNSPSTYSFLTKHFVYSACWIKQPISVHLCPLSRVTAYKSTVVTYLTKQLFSFI